MALIPILHKSFCKPEPVGYNIVRHGLLFLPPYIIIFLDFFVKWTDNTLMMFKVTLVFTEGIFRPCFGIYGQCSSFPGSCVIFSCRIMKPIWCQVRQW